MWLLFSKTVKVLLTCQLANYYITSHMTHDYAQEKTVNTYLFMIFIYSTTAKCLGKSMWLLWQSPWLSK